MGNAGEPKVSSGEAIVLLFGQQPPHFGKEPVDELRSSLSDGTAQKWILDMVAELPCYWVALTKKIPEIENTIPGVKLLTDLDSWLRHGLDVEQESQPNMITTPLAVLVQVTQYWRYLEINATKNGNRGKRDQTDFQADFLERQKRNNNKVEAIGFSTGLLSAFAVASSKNQRELEKNSIVAVRLAMLIGALVDAQEEWNKELDLGKSKSYAVEWPSAKQGEDMRCIVYDLFPEAYIPVLYDETCATVTTSERVAPQLLEKLRAADITVEEIGLKGRFHSPDDETKRNTEALIELCDSLPTCLQFPDASHLILPSYSNSAEGEPITPYAGNMHSIAIRAILTQQCNWYETFTEIQAAPFGGDIYKHDNRLMVLFGSDLCVPPTLMSRLGLRLAHPTDLGKNTPHFIKNTLDGEGQLE
ncbi:hypothetical protein F4819DRAFT_503577 [Hypoxylon fuscum]|nr:hypothetical protein F4819DRAFT_503577 [Hypoxylon fuscum]